MIQPSPAGKRIVFLDSLRAIAVLLVLWSHIFLVGINEPATVEAWVPDANALAFGTTIGQENISSEPTLWGTLKNLVISVRGIGVPLFFVISGFVMLRTVDRTRPIPFIIQRFFRIVPTCLFCVALVAGVTYAYCTAKGISQPNTIEGILASAFAANYYNNSFPTLPVLWTLEVEIIFYVIMAIAATAFKRLGYKELVFISLLCLAAVSAYTFPNQQAKAMPDIFKHLSAILVHISYMMIGAVIYRANEDAHKLKGIIITFAAVAIYATAYKLFWNATNTHIGSSLLSSSAALIVFIVGMLVGMHSKIFAPLRWIASISYPLYLVHIPLAWGISYTLISLGFSVYLSATISTVAVVFIAWVVHHAVELPSQIAGKKISSVWKPQGPLAVEKV